MEAEPTGGTRLVCRKLVPCSDQRPIDIKSATGIRGRDPVRTHLTVLGASVGVGIVIDIPQPTDGNVCVDFGGHKAGVA